MTEGVDLHAGLERLGEALPAPAEALLSRYLALIVKWNKVYNLTAIQDPSRMVVEHLLDSLSILALVRPERILDVGTGAGLPGIPLALARPQWRVTVLDSSHKRCAFLRQTVIELGLANVDIACVRVEQFRPTARYDTVVSRAFTDTAGFAAAVRDLTADDGVIVAMKGQYPAEELTVLPSGVRVREVLPLSVPGLEAQRHAVIMTKAST